MQPQEGRSPPGPAVHWSEEREDLRGGETSEGSGRRAGGQEWPGLPVPTSPEFVFYFVRICFIYYGSNIVCFENMGPDDFLRVLTDSPRGSASCQARLQLLNGHEDGTSIPVPGACPPVGDSGQRAS